MPQFYKALIFCFLFTLLSAWSSPEAKAQEIEFTANLRSLDHANIFDTSDSARLQMWNNFFANDIRKIKISQALLSPLNPNGTPRPVKTYLSAAELQNLRNAMNRGPGSSDDFHVTYGGGYGLRNDACQSSTAPGVVALNAATWEYNNIVRPRLLDYGIPIRAVSIDGPFLRVIKNSKKGSSCALGSHGGFSSTDTAIIVRNYLKHLRNLINAHGTNAQAQVGGVKISIIINLPNWKVKQYPAIATAGNTGDLVDDILIKFRNAMLADSGNLLSLDGFDVDYPYNFVMSNGINIFKNKAIHLRNRAQTLPRTDHRLTFITNTGYDLDPGAAGQEGHDKLRGTVECVWLNNDHISWREVPYLPYENFSTTMPSDCVVVQNVADERFWNESATFANNIKSGSWRHSNFPLSDVKAFRFSSWNEMPVSTYSTMNRTLRYKLYGN